MDRMEWRKVRRRLTLEDCAKTHLVVVGVEWRTSPSDAGAETGGGYSREMRTVTEGKKKFMTSINSTFTSDFRCKEESNNIISHFNS